MLFAGIVALILLAYIDSRRQQLRLKLQIQAFLEGAKGIAFV
jgi:hypothetical protein